MKLVKTILQVGGLPENFCVLLLALQAGGDEGARNRPPRSWLRPHRVHTLDDCQSQRECTLCLNDLAAVEFSC